MRVTLGDYYCTGSPYVFFGEKMNRGNRATSWREGLEDVL